MEKKRRNEDKDKDKKENFFLNNKKYKQYKQNLSNYYYLRIHQM